MRVAFVEVGEFNRSLDEVIDFFTFNPFPKEKVNVLRKFILSSDPSKNIDGVERIEKLSFIKDYDEVILFGVGYGFNYSVITYYNKRVRLRLYDRNKKIKLEKIHSVFSTEKGPKYGDTKTYNVPLQFSLNFIPREIEIKSKKNIIFDNRFCKKQTINDLISKFSSVEDLIKHDYNLVIIGDVSSKQKDILNESGFSYDIVEVLNVFNYYSTIIDSVMYIVPEEGDKKIENSVKYFCYQLESVYYDLSNLLELNEDKIKELLIVRHFRELLVQKQFLLLENL